MSTDGAYRNHALRRAYQAYNALWQEYASADISPVQFGVLHALCENGGLPQNQLAQLAHLDKSTLAELLRRMERQGVVATERDTKDRRRKTVTVTEQGRSIHQELRPASIRVNELLTSALSPQEILLLDTLLTKIADREVERA
ncbi:MarR family transcriptional regulator [Salinibacterium sp. SYSU T00001]|uniref:MarR family winged helix-turn-helix transcriptional regulator n=1 Tax=Homoserinimonas sedimenticola TaxID=2986805 RepID=UPI0022355662|nr:MarR family transcriptional regulator [Salinibacterium sedimenticola]MCW4386201.1 MarR family transcriptional regulator [Salinibacterium sedimenticola]